MHVPSASGISSCGTAVPGIGLAWERPLNYFITVWSTILVGINLGCHCGLSRHHLNHLYPSASIIKVIINKRLNGIIVATAWVVLDTFTRQEVQSGNHSLF